MKVSSERRFGSVFFSFSHGFIQNRYGLFGFGNNRYGQLGISTALSDKVDPPEVVDFFSGVEVSEIVVGDQHSLFLCGADAYSCGRNSNGQLFLGDTINRSFPTKFRTGVERVFTACDTSFIYSSKLGLRGCGFGMGKIGSGESSEGIVNIKELKTKFDRHVKFITGGLYHTLFLTHDGNLFGSGSNQKGQLGMGSEKFFSVPIQITSGVKEISSGAYHSVFLTTSGVHGMGSNQKLQLGVDKLKKKKKLVRSKPQKRRSRSISKADRLGIKLLRTDLAYSGVLSGHCGWYYSMLRKNDSVITFGWWGRSGISPTSSSPQQHVIHKRSSIAVASRPGKIKGLPSDISSIHCGYTHTFFVTGRGEVLGFGSLSGYELASHYEITKLYRNTKPDVYRGKFNGSACSITFSDGCLVVSNSSSSSSSEGKVVLRVDVGEVNDLNRERNVDIFTFATANTKNKSFQIVVPSSTATDFQNFVIPHLLKSDADESESEEESSSDESEESEFESDSDSGVDTEIEDSEEEEEEPEKTEPVVKKTVLIDRRRKKKKDIMWKHPEKMKFFKFE